MQITWEQIQLVVVEQLGCFIEEVTPDATWEDLGADSLDRVELTLALENEFNIVLNDELLIECNTLREAMTAFGYMSARPYLFEHSLLVQDCPGRPDYAAAT